ncbi:MAG: hypothetical protein EXS31_02435 [Pedosphaera sp.]|nr:hypothetical protein [Pedosphaera sp.]
MSASTEQRKPVAEWLEHHHWVVGGLLSKHSGRESKTKGTWLKLIVEKSIEALRNPACHGSCPDVIFAI